MLNLDQYSEIALKIISNWQRRRGNLHVSDDLIGAVIYNIARADEQYDASQSNLSAYQYRQMMGIYAIRNYIKSARRKHKRELIQYNNFSHTKKIGKSFRNIVINYFNPIDQEEVENKRRKLLKFLIGNAGLNKLQRNCIELVISGKTPDETAETLQCNIKNVYSNIQAAIYKMRRISRGNTSSPDLLD